jgi:isoleucyl-tRNA synthetase
LNFPTGDPETRQAGGDSAKHLQSLSHEEAKKIVEQGFFDFHSPAGEKVLVGKEDLIMNQKTQQGLEMASNTTFSVDV